MSTPMLRSSARWLWLTVAALLAATFTSVPASAQEEPPTPTATLSANRQGNLYTLADLGYGTSELAAPADQLSVTFTMPTGERLAEGATAELNLIPSIYPQSLIADGRAVAQLTVSFNDEPLATLDISSLEPQTIRAAIPAEAIAAASGERHTLQISLAANVPCGDDRVISVAVQSGSRLFLPTEPATLATDLSDLPRPLYQRSFVPESAIIVIPDQPTAEELQAAMVTAAGIGRMTGNRLPLDLRRVSDLTEADQASHLVAVGKPAGLPLLSDVQLPLALQGGSFPAAQVGEGTGVVMMTTSPLSPTRALLLVSGADDTGVVKASQSLAARRLIVGEDPSLALIAGSAPVVEEANLSPDRTLADLGYPDARRVGSAGRSTFNYGFTVPRDSIPEGEVYLDLIFAHAALLDYDQSGLTVAVNGVDVGGARFSDENISLGQARISIPSSLILPGDNTLTIRPNLIGRAVCDTGDSVDLWVTVFPETTLHLALADASTLLPRSLTLAEYPQPFTGSTDLGTMGFIFNPDEPGSWATGARLAASLGAITSGPLVNLVALYADAIPEELRQERDLIIVGRPSGSDLIPQLYDELPAPFSRDSDQAVNRENYEPYNLSRGADVGYLQLFRSPWNPQRQIATVLGTSELGVEWAGQALLQGELRRNLSGTFAIIIGDQIFIGGTRLSTRNLSTDAGTGSTGAITTTIAGVVTSTQVVSPATTTVDSSLIPQSTPSLVLPLIISGSTMILATAAALAIVWLRRRRRSS